MLVSHNTLSSCCTKRQKHCIFITLITRVSEVIMFPPCVFVCLCVSLSRCLSGRLNYEGLVPHKHYFAGTLLGVSGLVVQAMFHALIDDVTRSQSRSNFEIDISPSIFELTLERRSKAQNIGNANGYFSGIFNFRWHFRWKSLSRAQNGCHFENFEILHTASIWPQIWKVRPKLYHKQRVLMHRHQGWNVWHGLCHIYMRYLYIYEMFIAFVCFVVCSLL